LIFFFDTSALVKRYLHEKESARVRRLLQTGGAIFYQAFLAPLEMTSALYRRHRSGEIPMGQLSVLLRSYAAHSHRDYFLVPYSESLIDLAETLISRHPLRALDAIQLASALALRSAQYPFVHAWLTAKVLALLAYIVFGSIALKYGRSRRVRALSYGMALGVFLYIVAVAIARSPAAGLA